MSTNAPHVNGTPPAQELIIHALAGNRLATRMIFDVVNKISTGVVVDGLPRLYVDAVRGLLEQALVS